jgi:hypothetical protein
VNFLSVLNNLLNLFLSVQVTVRRESASGVARLLGEEVNLNIAEYKKLVEGLVRRLRDVDESVVIAANHSIGHIRGHIGEDTFGMIVKKLSFAHQQVCLQILFYSFLHLKLMIIRKNHVIS